jgi:hypothetical protein
MSLLSLEVVREVRPDTTTLLPLHQYDLVVAAFSGGKDSLALALDVLGRGVDPSRVQLWHHLVDGRPGVDPRFVDWPWPTSRRNWGRGPRRGRSTTGRCSTRPARTRRGPAATGGPHASATARPR